MTNFAKQKKPVTTEFGFGGCPECGDTMGCIEDGAKLWFVCTNHKTKWLVSSGSFPKWYYATAEQCLENRLMLDSLTSVEPVYPPYVMRQNVSVESSMRRDRYIDKLIEATGLTHSGRGIREGSLFITIENNFQYQINFKEARMSFHAKRKGDELAMLRLLSNSKLRKYEPDFEFPF